MACSARSIKSEHIAHAQHARNDALRIKSFQRVIFLADAHKLHGRPGHFADGKRRAAARVAVKFGKDHAGQAQPAVEFAGRTHRVLPDHGVGDEQDFGGLQFALEMAEFAHQFIVDMQTPGRVNEDHIGGRKLGFADGSFGDFQRLVGACARPAADANGLSHLRELFAGCGPVNVGRDD